MFALTLLTFDCPLYQESLSSAPENSPVKTLFHLHKLLIDKMKGFNVTDNDLMAHPLLQMKSSVERINVCTHIHDYFEFIKTLPDEWIEQLFPIHSSTESSSSSSSSSGVVRSARDLIPSYPNVRYTLRQVNLTRIETEFGTELQNQLKDLPFVVESIQSPAIHNSFPIDFQISEKKKILQGQEKDEIGEGKEEKKELKALIEIYSRNLYDDNNLDGEFEFFRRHELLKTYFYSHYLPDIPFYRLRESDIVNDKARVARMLLEQVIPQEILAKAQKKQ
jgi:hypothetical protein